MKNKTKGGHWKKKKKERQGENKETERELWSKLSALNKEFKDIRETKICKKMSKTVLKAYVLMY